MGVRIYSINLGDSHDIQVYICTWLIGVLRVIRLFVKVYNIYGLQGVKSYGSYVLKKFNGYRLKVNKRYGWQG